MLARLLNGVFHKNAAFQYIVCHRPIEIMLIIGMIYPQWIPQYIVILNTLH